MTFFTEPPVKPLRPLQGPTRAARTIRDGAEIAVAEALATVPPAEACLIVHAALKAHPKIEHHNLMLAGNMLCRLADEMERNP